MGVATHLGIDLADYDARIRTFIPDYEMMLDAAAAMVPPTARTIVDLGTGTGALAARCLARVPRARIVGVDADGEILEAAKRRLGSRATFVLGSFRHAPLPPCDVVVTSLALHHIRTRSAKTALYRRLHAALRPGGLFLAADCHPAASSVLARRQREAWTAHLRKSYTAREATALFAAWAKEDVYVPLDAETGLLRRSGFAVDVVWRQGSFAVLGCWRRAVRAGGSADR